MSEPLLVPDTEAAKMLGIGRSTLWALVKQGKAPPPVKPCGRTLWRVSDLQRHVQAMTPTTP